MNAERPCSGTCGGADLLSWHGFWFCVICDNPDVGEGTWFTLWGLSVPEGLEEI